MLKVILFLLAIVFLPHIIIAIGIYYAAYIFWKKVFQVGNAIYNGEDITGGGGGGSSERDGTEEFHSTGAPYL